MRGNDEWEQRFRRKIESLWFQQEASTAGIRYGDLIKFPAGNYTGETDKWIEWML
jgi:hypothetical protein